MNTLLKGVVGSVAYGLATPSSDLDFLAVHMDPLHEVLSLGWHPSTRIWHDPDCQSHELGKYLKLACSANPTIMELLWLDAYEIMTPLGGALIEMRNTFLTQRCRQTYGGYARQQAHRLVQRGGTFDPDLAKRTKKHGRHCARLLIQGKAIAEHGTLRIKLTEDERSFCFAMGELAGRDIEEFRSVTEELFVKMDAAFDACDLPAEPDEAAVSEFLVAARLAWQ